jgi:hypothetical protein
MTELVMVNMEMRRALLETESPASTKRGSTVARRFPYQSLTRWEKARAIIWPGELLVVFSMSQK